MITWSFTLRLNRVPTVDELDALFDAGLDDSTPEGDLLHIDRTAETMLDAAWSAARQVTAVAGLWALRIEYDDAVTLRDIAQRLNRTYESARLLAEGSRGPGNFPAPLLSTTAGRIWSWRDVGKWIETHFPNLHTETSTDDKRVRAADAMIQLAASYREASEADRRRMAAVLDEVAAA